ncbi:serine hydrolase [Pacificimonas flava]|uniref:Serine hydrolase n=2 Tax=Pacificimonas TaxID=1960290 RepID=A0A219B831_9SPHN|nr:MULTISPECIES: serine hydrolase domain-containing protein [Pacificimonas]MBZ6380021.1 beta-lactamase family protein [Pacificimonas aurantium]OWV34535.1 serine hydrolase [Pacificimonas flava]
MPRYLLAIPVTLIAMAGWAALCFIAVDGGLFRTPLTQSADPAAFARAATQKIEEEARGNLVFALIEEGDVVARHSTSAGEPVDGESLFQVASLSKWVSAWGVMALAEDGLIDLDAPASTYLTRWELPPSPYDHDGVTVRRLLSHMAGLGDGLGYDGFPEGEPVQSLEDSLTQAKDASSNASGAVRVVEEPGSGWSYSGGGYTLLQLLIEEISGMSFDDYMRTRIFRPLGMTDTGYVLDEAERTRLAENYDAQGRLEPLNRYTSLAATSLYTTANDMARFIEAQGPQAAPPGRGVLSPETLAAMRVPHASQMGADIWGLGTMLYAANNRGDFIIGHDGNNEPAINTAVRLDPDTGDGIVVLETGNSLLATDLAGDWVFWKTGNVDFLDFSVALPGMLRAILIGGVVILLLGILLGWELRRKDRRRG